MSVIIIKLFKGNAVMLFELILVTLILISVLGVKYSDLMFRLFTSGKFLLKNEKLRYKENFLMSESISPRGPTMCGNKYERSESGKIKVTSEERSSLIAYI